MTLPLPPQHTDENDPLTWINRIRNAAAVQPGHPLYERAQQEIPLMKTYLRHAIDLEHEANTAISEREQQEALDVGPIGTAAEKGLRTITSTLEGVSDNPFVMLSRLLAGQQPDHVKDLLNSIAGGPAVEISEAASPFATKVGTAIGVAAPLVAGGAAGVARTVARRGAMKAAQLEGAQWANRTAQQGFEHEAAAEARRSAQHTALMEGRELGTERSRLALQHYLSRLRESIAPVEEATGEAAQRGAAGATPMGGQMTPIRGTTQGFELTGTSPTPVAPTSPPPSVADMSGISNLRAPADLVENAPAANQAQKSVQFGQGSPLGSMAKDQVKQLLGEIYRRIASGEPLY